ncbi:hypothetical protein [Hyphococcus sp.]|uniref:hypothetical protein n=1 Tax=Hyphococcus sp. TaxID=2038636 RepID=UPI00208643D7|nr:MAG: hypothetical protein DHS20C04_30900 [Marinicaulis sp.]
MAEKSDYIAISFQWAVGDTRALEKHMGELVRFPFHHAVIVASRIVALALVFALAYFLFPEIEAWKLIILVLAASLSIWVSWALSVGTMRTLERLQAKDPRYVGCVNVRIDERGLFWADDVSQYFLSWLGVSDVEEIDGAIWIKSGDVTGFYLPARVFESSEQTGNYKRTIDECRSRATPPIHTGQPAQDSPRTVH